MEIITTNHYLKYTADATVAIEIIDGDIRLIAEVEHNENVDEEDYTEHRICYYNWLCENKGELGLLKLIDDERSNHAGGIYIYNHDDAFGEILTYMQGEFEIMLFEDDAESGAALKSFGDGYYIVVIQGLCHE